MKADRTQGNSLARMLNIFELFDTTRPTIHVDDVAKLNDFGLSTAYRHLQELCNAGLLSQNGKSEYSLGPRIIELERLQQLTDPLLLAGRRHMADLVMDLKNKAILLCSLYNDRVLCIHHVGEAAIEVDGKRVPISRGRGMPLPLFKGAGSQVILANLPPHRARSIFAANGASIAEAGLGEDWDSFRKTLAAIKRQNFAVSYGQITDNLIGLAVPILRADKTVMGSLLMMDGGSGRRIDQDRSVEILTKSAESISRDCESELT